MKYKYLLFDLDGTLTDPAEGITRAVSFALSHFGIHIEDRTTLYPFIGPPLKDSFRDFYGFSDAQIPAAEDKYREYFSEKGIFENKIYPGIGELLASLKESGAQILLATSKPEVFAERILEHFHIREFFNFVGGATMDGIRSEKKDVVRYVLDSGGIEKPTEAVMIGDRRHDIEGAQANGLDSIGVLWGYGNRGEFQKAGASYTVQNIEELSLLLSGD